MDEGCPLEKGGCYDQRGHFDKDGCVNEGGGFDKDSHFDKTVAVSSINLLFCRELRVGEDHRVREHDDCEVQLGEAEPGTIGLHRTHTVALSSSRTKN